MMKSLAERLWGEASPLMPSLGCLIDRFLDWIEEVSAVMMPVHVKALAVSEVPTEARLDTFRA